MRISNPTRMTFLPRQTEGEVGSYESLAFTAYGGGNQDDFLIRIAHHEEQVGAQAAEGFRHDVVVVFAYGNGRLFMLV